MNTPQSVQKEETRKEILEAVSVHKEGEELDYCDTGSDMEMWCRADCVKMARARVEAVLAKHDL